MNRAEIKRLAKAKNPKLQIRENKWAIDPETREICRAAYLKLKHQEPQPPPPTPEMLAYRAKRRAWLQEMENLRGKVFTARRYEVYEDWGLGRHIVGSGDSWEHAAREAGLIPKEPTS